MFHSAKIESGGSTPWCNEKIYFFKICDVEKLKESLIANQTPKTLKSTTNLAKGCLNLNSKLYRKQIQR